jgi:hypothetical protein
LSAAKAQVPLFDQLQRDFIDRRALIHCCCKGEACMVWLFFTYLYWIGTAIPQIVTSLIIKVDICKAEKALKVE